ncbi:MAG: hypothetical protein JWO76_2483, partial [Nocardioides sp.]|nr:hypothetical protein [Nocardioides sp.]
MGPAQRPLEERLVAGRRALRRRRLGSAAAALAVVATFGMTYAVAEPGGNAARPGQVATDPTPSPSPTRDEAPESTAWHKGEAVRYSVDGELEVRPGVVVHERIENPYDYDPPKRSDALDLTFEGHRTWAIVELTNGKLSSSLTQPSNGWASFADYVADQVASGSAGSGWPDTLRLTDQGTVVARAGSEILQRTDDPKLGDSFAPPGTPTGAAVVRAAEDGVGYFVVWRVIQGELDVITTPPN